MWRAAIMAGVVAVTVGSTLTAAATPACASTSERTITISAVVVRSATLDPATGVVTYNYPRPESETCR